MKTQAYQILCSVYELLQQSPSTVPAADLIATALELDPLEATLDNLLEDLPPYNPETYAPNAPIAPIVTAAEPRRASADPRPETPAPEPRKKPIATAATAVPNRREKLISQIQSIIDEAHTDDAATVLQRTKSAGIPMGAIADLLGVNIHVVYNTARGKNKGGEQKFWKTFAKPNITPKEEAK